MNREGVLNKLKEVLDNDVVKDDYHLRTIKEDVESLLLSQYLEDMTGVKVNGGACGHYIDYTSFRDGVFVKLGGESPCNISWEDNSLEPKEGWYFKLLFSTGAYIFDQMYPKNTFDVFFQTLKSFGADYCDTNNHALYFNVETNSGAIKDLVSEYDKLFKVYYDLAKQEVLQEKIREAEAQLEALRGE